MENEIKEKINEVTFDYIQELKEILSGDNEALLSWLIAVTTANVSTYCNSADNVSGRLVLLKFFIKELTHAVKAEIYKFSGGL